MTFSSTLRPLELRLPRLRRRPQCGAMFCRRVVALVVRVDGRDLHLCEMHADVFPPTDDGVSS